MLAVTRRKFSEREAGLGINYKARLRLKRTSLKTTLSLTVTEAPLVLMLGIREKTALHKGMQGHRPCTQEDN